MDLGFKQAGFETIYATDSWNTACDTLNLNKAAKKIECADIRSVNFKQVLKEFGLKNIDCLIGGPPCPAYSKSRFYLKDKARAMQDENSFTLKEYFRAIKETKPKVFFFENVHGFIYRPHQEAFEFLKKTSEELGYKIFHKVVNTALYGIPQTRERFLCVGVQKKMIDFEFPEETHFDPTDASTIDLFSNKKPWVCCGEILNDIDFILPEDVKMRAGSRHHDLLKKVPPGDNYLFFTRERKHPKPLFKWRSRYWSFLLKLSPNRPAWTIQASHSNNMGPFHWRNRFLRIREIARIQTFPDSYQILGDYRDQWRQIGNALPPLMAKIIGEEIKAQYFGKQEAISNKKSDALIAV